LVKGGNYRPCLRELFNKDFQLSESIEPLKRLRPLRDLSVDTTVFFHIAGLPHHTGREKSPASPPVFLEVSQAALGIGQQFGVMVRPEMESGRFG